MSNDNNSKTIAIEKIQKYMEKMSDVNITEDKKQLYSKKLEQWYNVMIGGGCDNVIKKLLKDRYHIDPMNISQCQLDKYIELYCLNYGGTYNFKKYIDTILDPNSKPYQRNSAENTALQEINCDTTQSQRTHICTKNCLKPNIPNINVRFNMEQLKQLISMHIQAINSPTQNVSRPVSGPQPSSQRPSTMAGVRLRSPQTYGRVGGPNVAEQTLRRAREGLRNPQNPKAKPPTIIGISNPVYAPELMNPEFTNPYATLGPIATLRRRPSYVNDPTYPYSQVSTPGLEKNPTYYATNTGPTPYSSPNTYTYMGRVNQPSVESRESPYATISDVDDNGYMIVDPIENPALPPALPPPRKSSPNSPAVSPPRSLRHNSPLPLSETQSPPLGLLRFTQYNPYDPYASAANPFFKFKGPQNNNSNRNSSRV